MKVLVIGSGGREHAIAYKLKQSPKVTELYAIPGNPGIAQIGTCIPGSVEDKELIIQFIKDHQIDLTVIGPEVPLCLGLADDIEAAGFKAFGPQKKAATLEGSKAFSKDFMVRHHIPTARYVEVNDFDTACKEIAQFSYPLVIKADGLAAGKGVVIVDNKDDAIATLKDMMVDGALDGAGSKVVLEEFLTGFECSLLCFTDGKTIVPMVSAKDHKQVYDGNKGPNTGGMGTFSPSPFYTDEVDAFCKENVYQKTMDAMKAEGRDFVGVLFCGLMLTSDGPKVLEYNARFGDPETQVVLPRMKNDIIEVMEACVDGRLDEIELEFEDQAAVCVVLASEGYPEHYEKGYVIHGLETFKDKEGYYVFHAGSKMTDKGIVTNGGRVLGVTAKGSDLVEARANAYKATEWISFDNKYMRHDIGKAIDEQ